MFDEFQINLPDHHFIKIFDIDKKTLIKFKKKLPQNVAQCEICGTLLEVDPIMKS